MSLPVPLPDRPSFLLARLGIYAGQGFGQLLEPLGLQPPQFGLVSYLAEEDGRTQQQLADVLAVHRNVMVGLVDDLEGRGLVERRRHPRDRRAHALFLTKEGRAVLNKARALADQHDAALLEVLDDRSRQRLIDALQEVATAAGIISPRSS